MRFLGYLFLLVLAFVAGTYFDVELINTYNCLFC